MTEASPTRVGVVDDHRFLAQTLVIALHDAGFDALVIDPLDDVRAMVGQWQASVVLLDLQLSFDRLGDDLVRPLVDDGRAVVVLTSDTDRARWGECLLAGAAGVLAKTAPLEDVVAAVDAAAHGRAVNDERDRFAWLRAADRRRAERDQTMAPFRALTPREEVVLEGLVRGMPAADIARQATVSEATVRTQIRAVLSKLGVTSQLQAVARARRAGWRGPRA